MLRLDRLTCGMISSLLISSCGSSESVPGPGLGLQVRVAGAQIRRGGLGRDEGGPEVTQILRPQPQVERGDGSVKLNGRLGPGGVALHLHARGDADHWVLPAKGFDFVVADELQWAAELEVSYAVQTESLELTLQAADERGRLGPTQETSLGLLPDVPAAQLLVSLAWDAAVDLDLHVELPNGTIVGAKNINSIEPSAGAVATAEEALQGGFLDYDSNQHCEFDLRNRENVVWLNDTAPSGKYKVYAHLFSPCASHAVNFTAAVEYEGEILNQASSTLVAFDSRVHPTEGAAPGLLLLEFKIP